MHRASGAVVFACLPARANGFCPCYSQYDDGDEMFSNRKRGISGLSETESRHSEPGSSTE
jgi:hypothetical protein